MAHIHNKDLSIFMAFIVCEQYRSCYYSKLVINHMYWWLPVGNWRAMSATTFRFLWQWFSIDSNDRACSCKTHRIYNKFDTKDKGFLSSFQVLLVLFCFLNTVSEFKESDVFNHTNVQCDYHWRFRLCLNKQPFRWTMFWIFVSRHIIYVSNKSSQK